MSWRKLSRLPFINAALIAVVGVGAAALKWLKPAGYPLPDYDDQQTDWR